ncbi:MAG: purine-binding chemotaxis protein CheW [Planctomycetes bacterium]|nr:purine-binding chemotaxis protein CheW [Planctomycetota bacterium]
MQAVAEQPPPVAVNEPAPPPAAGRELGGKYLTFLLDDEEHGLEILKVREIIGIMDITRVPQTPDFVRGVINLRGKVIPVIDLRLKFGLQPAEYNDQTCIIVVDVGLLMGIIVDTVQEVHDIPASNIEPPPQLGAHVDTSFILGMGKVKDDVKILLDIDKVLTGEELVQVQAAVSG